MAMDLLRLDDVKVLYFFLTIKLYFSALPSSPLLSYECIGGIRPCLSDLTTLFPRACSSAVSKLGIPPPALLLFPQTSSFSSKHRGQEISLKGRLISARAGGHPLRW